MAKMLEEHHGYLRDNVKIRQYEAALSRVVRPGHVVLDLGCGTGLLGLIALRAGARKVYFLERDSIIEAARQTVTAAGFADRAEFLQGNSFQLTLPERVDVVVCDHVGYFGIDYDILAVLKDARVRFLQPGGIIVPEQIDLKLAPVESESCRNLVSQWRDGTVPGDFSWLGDVAANTKHGVELKPEDLLADAENLGTVILGDEALSYLSWTTEFSCARTGTLDGVAGWFDCRLVDNVHMSNSPMAAGLLERPQAFFPLETPLAVNAGDKIRATVMVRPGDQVIAWVIELPGTGRRFTHTTFNGQLLDTQALTRAFPDRVAKLNDRGKARQIVLSYCDGKRTVAEVQAMIQDDHPDLFPSPRAASAFMMQVLSWDTSE